MTSYQRRCDVITSNRRRYDVILAPYANWVLIRCREQSWYFAERHGTSTRYGYLFRKKFYSVPPNDSRFMRSIKYIYIFPNMPKKWFALKIEFKKAKENFLFSITENETLKLLGWAGRFHKYAKEPYPNSNVSTDTLPQCRKFRGIFASRIKFGQHKKKNEKKISCKVIFYYYFYSSKPKMFFFHS